MRIIPCQKTGSRTSQHQRRRRYRRIADLHGDISKRQRREDRDHACQAIESVNDVDTVGNTGDT